MTKLKRLAASFTLQGGLRPIYDMRDAAQKHGVRRFSDDMARDMFLTALSRALKYDQQSRTSGVPDDYPEAVRLTVILEPEPKSAAAVAFEDAV